MAQFYGTLLGSHGQASRLGGKASGLNTIAASWNGGIEVSIHYNSETGEDRFCIYQTPWHGQGINELIATGFLRKPAKREAAE